MSEKSQNREKRFKAAIIGVLLVFGFNLLGGCVKTVNVKALEEAGHKRLNSDEITELLTGKTLRIESATENAVLSFMVSGEAKVGDAQGGMVKGRWVAVDGDELCVKFKRYWYGDLRCFILFRDGSDLRFFTRNGAPAFKAVIIGETAGPVAGKGAPKTGKKSLIINRKGAVPNKEKVEEKASLRWLAGDCPGCNLAGAKLQGSDLAGANLRGADLLGADLREANLRRADLRDANLASAKLVFTNLAGANLRGANLRGADLTGANLIMADLQDADITGAVFQNALLEGVKGLDAGMLTP